MLTPSTYLVPAEGALVYVVERDGVYGVGGVSTVWSETLAITTTGPAVTAASGLTVPADVNASPRYVWFAAGTRVYVRAFNAAGPIAGGVSLWLHRPDGA